MARPDKRIKKISTAMKRGYKISKENGIIDIKGEMFLIENGKCTGACALGMAYIGKFGIPNNAFLPSKVIRDLNVDNTNSYCVGHGGFGYVGSIPKLLKN